MYDMHLLDTHTAPAYAGLTFPRYRHLLKVEKDETVAVGVNVLGRPVGLALGWHRPAGETARVLSVRVAPNYRNQGLGTALLARLEAELARRRARQLQGEYQAGKATTPAVKALLAHAGWGTPRLARLVCMTNLETITKAPWMHDYTLPEGFETFLWPELTDADVAHLKQWWPEQCRLALTEDWEEESIAPFVEGRTVSEINSLGLRHRGQVVGWMLTDRVAPDTLRYDRLFVAHEFRRLGLGVMLLAASIWAHYRAEGHLTPSRRGVWQTQAANRPMIAFIRRRMAPYLTALTEVYTASKQLTEHHNHPQSTLTIEETNYA
jgi:GNAT superfamily N-acetyltransferase